MIWRSSAPATPVEALGCKVSFTRCGGRFPPEVAKRPSFQPLRWTFPTRSAKALKSAHVGAAFVRLVLENRKRLGRRLESGKNAGRVPSARQRSVVLSRLSAQGYISRPDPPLCAAFVALCGKPGGQRRVDFESNVYSAHISLMTGFGTAPPYRRSRWAYA